MVPPTSANRLISNASLIKHPRCRFLIIDAPNDDNILRYAEVFEQFSVKNVVRVCEPTYKTEPLLDRGVAVHEMPFPDGEGPPPDVVAAWLDLVETVFPPRKEVTETIAVHCVAGLGRAPVLAAISLVECGLDPLDAVRRVREKRRGAINSRQLAFLEHYHPRARRRGGCTAM